MHLGRRPAEKPDPAVRHFYDKLLPVLTRPEVRDGRMTVDLEEYEEVRARPTQFLLAPGHGEEKVEQVVEERGEFDIVDKVAPIAAAVARALNPRVA